jgi:shikimate dehydrogenase
MSYADQYAVFGHPISHSKSPFIHRRFAEQTHQALNYHAQDVPSEKFHDEVKNFFATGGKGLNCTVPLKELAWQYATQLTPRARLAKAVNTLALQADGSILGDNTDGVGLVRDLTDNHRIRLVNSRILILGAGGATRGIIGPLLDAGAGQITIANRSIAKADTIVSEFNELGSLASSEYAALADRQFNLILNATSASLSGELPPLPARLLADGGSCYDLAYGNKPTAFVLWGLENQAVNSLDGLGMLVEQAAEAFLLWRGVRPQTAWLIAELNNSRS